MAQETGSVGEFYWHRNPGEAAKFRDSRLGLYVMPVQMPPGEANGGVQFYADQMMWQDAFHLKIGADKIMERQIFRYRVIPEGKPLWGVQIAIAKIFADMGNFANIVAANESATAWNLILSSLGVSYDGMGTAQDANSEAYALQAAIARYDQKRPTELFTPGFAASVLVRLLASGALSSVGHAHS